MSVKLLTEHNLELLSLKGGCTGSPESTLVKIPHCWISHVTGYIMYMVISCIYHTGYIMYMVISCIYHIHDITIYMI